MENDSASASEIAKKRLLEFIENLILIYSFNDIISWGIYTFLLEQVKNFDPNNFSISSMAYKQDKDEALSLSQKKEIKSLITETIIAATGQQKEKNHQESEISSSERSYSRSF